MRNQFLWIAILSVCSFASASANASASASAVGNDGACVGSPAARLPPSATFRAAGPHLIVAMSESSSATEFERDPPLTRWSRPGPAMERHAADSDTAYRYRVRERARKDCDAGPWSDWVSTRTPAASSKPPLAPRMLGSSERNFVVTLRWDADDTDADGFALLRCVSDDVCVAAALLEPDEREFEFHTLSATTYVVIAFNEHGYSQFSNRTARIGTEISERIMGKHEALELSDSVAARRIDPQATSDEADIYCTTPQKLIKDGFTLIGIRGMEDLYRDPDGCGTGGCGYQIFTIENGCYGNHSRFNVLTTTPPFAGRDVGNDTGVVVTNSSGSASGGTILIYDGSDVVDEYKWIEVRAPLPGKRPPFHEYESLQIPENDVSPFVISPPSG